MTYIIAKVDLVVHNTTRMVVVVMTLYRDDAIPTLTPTYTGGYQSYPQSGYQGYPQGGGYGY